VNSCRNYSLQAEKKANAGGKKDPSRKRKIDTTRELVSCRHLFLRFRVHAVNLLLSSQEDDAGEAQVKLPMPFNLKKQLVDDWENITREPQMLVKLPRNPTVAQVR
jgi:hypothetical protein